MGMPIPSQTSIPIPELRLRPHRRLLHRRAFLLIGPSKSTPARPRVLPLGVSFRQLQRLVAEGTVEKLGGGVYRLSAVEPNELETIAMVASAAPNAIICLLTALRVHGIGTQSPHEVWIALDRKARKPRRVPTRLRIVRFSGAMLIYGVVQRSMLGVPVSITSPARTVVDCFRYRNKVGIDVAMEAPARRGPLPDHDRGRDRARCRGLPRPDRDADLPGGAGAMSRPPLNLAASIHRRLLNGARERGEDPQFILQRYAAERFLYRLGESPHREQFVLKGAMLFALWGGSVYRPTHDLDFTGYGSDDIEAVLGRIKDICSVPVPDDGMSFDATTLRAESIREEVEYGGFRIVFEARLDMHQIRMQVDVGFGNAIEPAATNADYPTLLDAPAPNIRAYPQEAVVAEKLHAMVVLGERNSRYKDFYDLHVLARQFSFNGTTLAGSIAATFERRQTPIDTALPAALAPRFYADGTRSEQWRAYLTRNALPGVPAGFDAIGERLQSFLGPPWTALMARTRFSGVWRPAGPSWLPEVTLNEAAT